MRKVERALTSGAMIAGLLFGGVGCASTTGGQNSNETLSTRPTRTEIAVRSTATPTVSVETTKPTSTPESFSRILPYGGYVWNVYTGIPKVDGQEILIPGSTDVQSEDVFYDGVLQGELLSLRTPNGESSGSSLGFERWWSTSKGVCHYGVLLKTNGNLAVFSPKIDENGKCAGDLLVQDYLPIPNWDTIRAGGVISFTLGWNSKNVLLKVSGNGKEEQISYSGPAIPDVPLGIRLYAQDNDGYRVKNLANYYYPKN